MSRRQKHKSSSISLKLPRSISGILLLVIGFLAGYVFCESQAPKISLVTDTKGKIEVCFSPEGNCEKLIIGAIQAAKNQILVQTYSFTSQAISQALIEAHNNGIDVKILFDQSQLNARHSQIPALQQAGIPTKVDRVAGLAHNKIMVIDHSTILTGSYNWTQAANTRNAENLLQIHDPALAHIYADNWLKRYER